MSLWTGAALVAVLAAATTSWTAGSSILLTDEHGAPASEAYVRYYYSGVLINPVHPVTYVARGSVIVRSDAGGRAAIPFSVQFRRPFPLSTPPSLFIDCLYVPRLHNAFGPLASRTPSHPGVFSIDGERNRVTVFDVSEDPERWEASLRHLFDCIRGTVSPTGSIAPAAAGDAATAAHARQLIGHLRRDYAAFVARYAKTARARPTAPAWLPERDRKAWEDQIDARLAREPAWGPYIERTWREELAALDRFEASLK